MAFYTLTGAQDPVPTFFWQSKERDARTDWSFYGKATEGSRVSGLYTTRTVTTLEIPVGDPLPPNTATETYREIPSGPSSSKDYNYPQGTSYPPPSPEPRPPPEGYRTIYKETLTNPVSLSSLRSAVNSSRWAGGLFATSVGLDGDTVNRYRVQIAPPLGGPELVVRAKWVERYETGFNRPTGVPIDSVEVEAGSRISPGSLFTTSVSAGRRPPTILPQINPTTGGVAQPIILHPGDNRPTVFATVGPASGGSPVVFGPATLNAAGQVIGVPVLSSGSNYSANFTVSFSSRPQGSPASASGTAIVEDGRVVSVSISAGGDYRPRLIGPWSTVLAIGIIGEEGELVGFSDLDTQDLRPTLTVSLPDVRIGNTPAERTAWAEANRATVSATYDSDGSIVSIDVTDGGNGYYNSPTISDSGLLSVQLVSPRVYLVGDVRRAATWAGGVVGGAWVVRGFGPAVGRAVTFSALEELENADGGREALVTGPINSPDTAWTYRPGLVRYNVSGTAVIVDPGSGLANRTGSITVSGNVVTAAAAISPLVLNNTVSASSVGYLERVEAAVNYGGTALPEISSFSVSGENKITGPLFAVQGATLGKSTTVAAALVGDDVIPSSATMPPLYSEPHALLSSSSPHALLVSDWIQVDVTENGGGLQLTNLVVRTYPTSRDITPW